MTYHRVTTSTEFSISQAAARWLDELISAHTRTHASLRPGIRSFLHPCLLASMHPCMLTPPRLHASLCPRAHARTRARALARNDLTASGRGRDKQTGSSRECRDFPIVDFHGKMWQTIATCDNMYSISGNTQHVCPSTHLLQHVGDAWRFGNIIVYPDYHSIV